MAKENKSMAIEAYSTSKNEKIPIKDHYKIDKVNYHRLKTVACDDDSKATVDYPKLR